MPTVQLTKRRPDPIQELPLSLDIITHSECAFWRGKRKGVTDREMSTGSGLCLDCGIVGYILVVQP